MCSMPYMVGWQILCEELRGPVQRRNWPVKEKKEVLEEEVLEEC